MKYLSIVIPCYNSQFYMQKAIESCLLLKEDVEVIIVDDGSIDRTGTIGEQYANQYPNTIQCIHQENGGHGEAVNTGLKHATGLYFKVLNSDDWFDQSSLVKVIETIKEFHHDDEIVDLIITNYIYEKASTKKSTVVKYKNAFPINRRFRWYDVKNFNSQQSLLIQNIIYRTKLLRNSNLKLPEHTFYVDNLFVYQPLPYVTTLYYLDVNLYYYFLGKDDHSTNEDVMISRVEQHVRVNKLMIDCCDIMDLKSRKLRNYMIKHLTMMTTLSTILLIKSEVPEHLAMRNDLWIYLKTKNPELYKAVKRTFLGSLMEVDNIIGQRALVTAYRFSRKFFGY